MRQVLRGITYRLFQPIDGASIAVFRMLFGAIMLWEVWRYFSHLNGREPARLVDRQVDLTEVEPTPFEHADWIEPLNEPLP